MVKQPIDLSGIRFGRLVAIERAENIGKKIAWLCRCDCGKENIVATTHLRSGKIQSCGCLAKEMHFTNNLKHGAKIGGKSKRLYNIWIHMKDRCDNENISDWYLYGGRGIKVCVEWHDYRVFEKWALDNGYNDSLSIDRIDYNGNYCPDNCRWANDYQQARNRRNNKYITINGETKSLAEWVEVYGANYNTVRSRIRYGWDPLKALTEKKDGRKNGN